MELIRENLITIWPLLLNLLKSNFQLSLNIFVFLCVRDSASSGPTAASAIKDEILNKFACNLIISLAGSVSHEMKGNFLVAPFV